MPYKPPRKAEWEAMRATVQRLTSATFELSDRISKLESQNAKLEETASYFASRAGAHKDEIIQHNIQPMGEDQGFESMFKGLMRGANDQASTAKFRQLKQHFQSYQAAIDEILTDIEELSRKNVLTTEHLRKFAHQARALITMARRS